MAGIILWNDFDLDDEEDEKYDLYDDEDFDIELEDDDDFEFFEVKCKNCGAIVEDGYQCEVCGWLVGA